MAKTKKKKKCPECGKFYENLGAHMVVHKKGNKKKAKKKKTNSKKVSAKKNSSSNNIGITKIKVIGVGGGGGNIISRMKDKSSIKGVEYIAINTDAQDLEEANAHKKIHIGKALTRGMGAGMNPDIGRQAVEENRSEIGEMLDGADIAFITAGFGGGTGSGAAPTIAEIAKNKGILTVGIITRPFKFEGSKRMTIAQEGIDQIRDRTDALVIIPNDRIFSVISKDTSILKAFEYIDDVLRNGVEAIADLINVPGIINVDFSDVEAILRDRGSSIIGVGEAKGQDRSIKAVEQVINSPLLETSIDGAKGVLFSISGGSDLKMSEVNDIAKTIVKSLDPNAQVIFGTSKGRGLNKNTIKVTVIATGFNGVSRPNSNGFSIPQLFDEKEKPKNYGFEKKEETKAEEEFLEPEDNEPEDDDSDSSPWDIPAFLRKKDK
jgi:cell division protein FtsZ